MLANLKKRIKLLALKAKIKILSAYYWRRYNGDLRYEAHMLPLALNQVCLDTDINMRRLIDTAQDTSNRRLSDVFQQLK